MESVAAVLIVKDAAHDLPRCLESLRWATEIIVVDSISSDNTVEVALRYTDKVTQRPWSGYAEQKNYAISLANSAWVLSIDADEVLPGETIAELQTVLTSPTAAGYRLPRRNIFYGHWVRGCGWYPDWQTRLFRKGAGEFQRFNVHESLQVHGPVGNLNNPILHYSYKSMSHYFGKSNHYTNLEVADFARNNTVVSSVDPFRVFFQKFGLAYQQQQGYLDGTLGLIISLGQSIYEFFKYLKTYQHYQQSGRNDLLRIEMENQWALAQFRGALSRPNPGWTGRRGFPGKRLGTSYSGLNAVLEFLRRRDCNAFLGEANRLSDADADRIATGLNYLRDSDILDKSLEAFGAYPGNDWGSLVLAMGAFTYSFMVWSKVWERLIWNKGRQAVQEALPRDQRGAAELVRGVEGAARYLYFVGRR